MSYLDGPYRLRAVNESVFEDKARLFVRLQLQGGLEATLRSMTAGDSQDLIDYVLNSGDRIQSTYEEGGGFYCMALGVGIAALRSSNPLGLIPAVEPEDWGSMEGREAELLSRPGLETLGEISGAGLLEVKGVNRGYVDGYRNAFYVPGLSQHIGFTGLGALNAHDLMHFASLRTQ